MTFSEALVLLKAGEDMRHADWPRTAYLRAVIVAGKPLARKIDGRNSTTYSPTQAEMFSQDWSKV